ncbi:hypothetical protein MSAN_00114600 [Mycena sanguinolenta]|uniref:F-box domain-containing protein n=1 Tax=Mycena sanguinolenta TaxID=230812 RepID=A0A8H6ZDD1_9AGAR|nr:hypothetical protein MSAN_00114600 [Mycena sanguinolenta]
MDALPPELIHAIVGEIGEVGSLKMCSLVSRIFLESCQKTLFRSLTIADDHVESSTLWSRLQESPHLGRYVESIVCIFPQPNAPNAELHALCGILDHLTNVRQCVLVGDPELEDLYHWRDLPTQFSAAIVNLIQRLQLSQLHVFSIASLPGDILTMFFAAAPTLTFLETSVDPMTTADVVGPSLLTLRNLAIACSPSIANVLTSPRCSPHVARIRKLWVDDASSRLISTMAQNLQHIRIEPDADKANLADFPPQLPCLQSSEIALNFDQRDSPLFITILSSLAEAASSTLEEICVTYAPLYISPLDSSLAPQTMVAVETAIVGCGGVPRIRWRLDVSRDREEFFNEFSVCLAKGMSKLHKYGRLIVERYSSDDEGMFSWVEQFSR